MEFNATNNKVLNLILNCENLLENLKNSVTKNYILSWFKEFCKNICICLSLLHKTKLEINTKNVNNYVYLHMIQLTTCTKLFLKLFCGELSNKIIIAEYRRFLKKRFIFIFDGIKKILYENTLPESNPGFIQWMDNVLDLISTLDPKEKNINNVKVALDEVLCHAMSISQICLEEDSKKIRASIQTILHEFKQLETEYNKYFKNPFLGNLYSDIVSDKLCLLERRVNTAVINISLKVFSNPLEPLKKLFKFCEENDKCIIDRTENDLDDLITKFDSHVDCMIQVGLFAVDCSTNEIVIAKIRNYLASLESLESELIPALTSLYMEPSKISCLYANLFVKHWCDEIKQLRNDVCFIIDPIAFSQILYEDFKSNLENIQDEFNNENVLELCRKVEVLILVVDASVKELKIDETSDIFKHFKDLKDVHKEVLAAFTLLKPKDNFKERVLKRLSILCTVVKRILNAFIENTNNSSQIFNSTSEQKNNFSDVIKNINLENYKERGLEILENRSILYKTPNKTKIKLFSTPGKKSESRKLGFSFIKKNVEIVDENLTLDLQITEILEEITNLAETLK